MSIHSGKKRFFIWDFRKNKIILSGLVSHGCCGHEWSSDQSRENPGFSNIGESHCTSLGKYKIGKRGYSEWGINVKYLLYGLENSNSNAYSRQIVLHGWNEVSDFEVYPSGTPEGWGCPSVSNNFMKIIDKLLKNSPKPVLLWIYI